MRNKTIIPILLCILFLSGTTVFAADSKDLIKQHENYGRVDLNPANALNRTQSTWHRYYWDGVNMVDVTYTAELNSAAIMKANVEANNTDENIKSGYGYTLDINSSVTGSKGIDGVPEVEAEKALASIQNMNVLFPEFNYEKGVTIKTTPKTKYNRLGLKQNLNQNGNISDSLVTFKPNPFSANESPVHFTPFWFPDQTTYVPFVEVFDAWTPGGMLGTIIKPTIDVDGQVYDDWHIAPIIKPKGE